MKQALQGRARFGSCELDPRAGELHHDGRSVILQEQQLKVLLILIERQGEIVTREEVRKRLWPNDTIVEFDYGINNTIKNLRRVLGDSADAPGYIATIKGRGYRLMVPVQWVVTGDSSGDEPSADPSSDDSKSLPRAMLKVGRLTGKVVSHYRVLEVLGGGGMGLVYRAEDLRLGRAVALKFLPEEVGDEPKARERFDREAHAVSVLNHHNICTVYDFDEHEGHPFIAMELLQGKTLRDHLAEGHFRLTQPEGLEVAIQIAWGLEAAHEKGIIHRDIKPANIFITDKNLAKILDFGVAKVMQLADAEPMAAAATASGQSQDRAAHSTLTRTGMKVGTAGYMSPEQVRGEPLDARTDIFSFGLVLYEMATGERAFTGETEAILHDVIQHNEPRPVRGLAPDISPKLEEVIAGCLEKERENRFQAMWEVANGLRSVEQAPTPATQIDEAVAPRASTWRRWLVFACLASVVIAVLSAVLYRRAYPPLRLTDKDTIVLADFGNKTGDEVFDGSLTEALRVGLEQTPFLNLLSPDKVNRVLKQAGHSERESLTFERAKEVCTKTRSAAVVIGSIEDAGNRYKIDLKAARCDTGAVIASAETAANQRNLIIQQLGRAAVALRQHLGEPAKTLQDFNQPLEIATTSSVEALRAFTSGQQQHSMGDEAKAVEYFRRAVETDANFAFAYERLGNSLWNLTDRDRPKDLVRKAYDLRDRLTRQQRLLIEGRYFELPTGDLEKAKSSWEDMLGIYPDSVYAHAHLGWIYRVLANYEQSAAEAREAIRLDPDSYASYYNLMLSEMALEQYGEAKAGFEEALSHGVDNEHLRVARFQVAFLERDDVAMQEQLRWTLEHPNTLWLRSEQAGTESYFGHMKKVKEIVDDLIAADKRAELTERAGRRRSAEAWWQAEVGNSKLAKEAGTQSLALHSGSYVRFSAAIALARSGEWRRAEELGAQLDAEMPQNAPVQHYDLPCLRAAIAISQGNAPEAIQVLEPSVPYEFGSGVIGADGLYPVYVRGMAYLQMRKGSEAAAQFRTIIGHPGIVLNNIWGALAYLQLARAEVMMGDKDAARKSYQDFLDLWKDADPDIPIYKQAKAEYAKLLATKDIN
jgi:eukaryotic-like serine/threonine-protein kinase